MYQPYTFQEQNLIQAHGQPNLMYLNSAIFDYWYRILFQRLTSVFEWTVPDEWLGTNKDFFNYVLFTLGFMGVFYNDKYGYIFQPCSFGSGRSIYRQPTSFIVTNPYDDSISGEYECGVDGDFLKITPDFLSPTVDLINFYASRLALVYTSINTSLLNCRNPRIFGARSKTGAQALKIVQDKVYSGDPFVILDTKILYPDAKTKDDVLFDIQPTSAKENYITDMLLEDEKTILKEFDNAVGITNLDEKKERLVTSEAEVQMQNSTASAFVWYDCLKDSIANIKEVFPDIKLDVNLRFNNQDIEETTKGGESDVSGSSDTQRN